MALGAFGHDAALDVTGDGAETQPPETVEVRRPAVANATTDTTDAVPDAEEETEKEEAAGGQEEEELFDYANLQEDEETRNYMPLWIKQRLDDPPVWPGASKDDFRDFFRSHEQDYRPPHRPKSDIEYQLVWQATTASSTLMWLERLEATILANERRAAVESLQMKSFAVVPSSKQAKRDLEAAAKEAAMDYFADPDHRKKLDACFVNWGFGTDAVAGEAFVRALPSLKEVARMKKDAMKQRDNALKQLDLAYDRRHPEQQMPPSMSAQRNFYREVKEDMELAKQERELEKAKQAAGHGDA
jgi:hypothetical protein